MKTVIGLFTRPANAEHALAELLHYGFKEWEIHVIASDLVLQRHLRALMQHNRSIVMHYIGVGTTTGALVGALIGTLIGFGIISDLGLGFFIGVGTMSSALITAAVGTLVMALAGSIIGWLIGLSLAGRQMKIHADGLPSNGVLIITQSSGERAIEALSIMRQARAIDLDGYRLDRHSQYREQNGHVATSRATHAPKDENGIRE